LKRHKARQIAFQIIYQIDVGKNELEDALSERIGETSLNKAGKSFCQNLVRGTVANLEKIDEIIEQYAIDWQVERIHSVDRNLLRLAIFEMLYCDDIPNKVSLNEAIELAKVFGSDDSAKFINGILDKLIHTYGE